MSGHKNSPILAPGDASYGVLIVPVRDCSPIGPHRPQPYAIVPGRHELRLLWMESHRVHGFLPQPRHLPPGLDFQHADARVFECGSEISAIGTEGQSIDFGSLDDPCESLGQECNSALKDELHFWRGCSPEGFQAQKD